MITKIRISSRKIKYISLIFALFLLFIARLGTYRWNGVVDQDLNFHEYTLSTGEDIQVYTIDLLVSNAYLVAGDNGMVLVDAGMPSMAPVIESYINKIGRDDLKLIYITHSHIDHFGSADELRSIYDAPIAIHTDDAEAISNGHTNLGMIRHWYMFSEKTLPLIEPLLSVELTKPDILFNGGENLDEYGIPSAEIIHLPGHTPGHSALVIDNNIAFVGDKLSAQGKDHIQKSYADSWDDLQDSIEILEGLNIKNYYAGHGPDVITQEEFQKLRY